MRAPAADGKANKAVVEAVAAALKARREQVRIVIGTRARTKVLELQDIDAESVARVFR